MMKKPFKTHDAGQHWAQTAHDVSRRERKNCMKHSSHPGGFFDQNEKAVVIAGRLLENTGKIRYGSVSVNLKIHDGRIADVTYTVTESTREHEGRLSKKETQALLIGLDKAQDYLVKNGVPDENGEKWMDLVAVGAFVDDAAREVDA